MVIIGNLGSPNRNKTSSIHKKKLIENVCYCVQCTYLCIYILFFWYQFRTYEHKQYTAHIHHIVSSIKAYDMIQLQALPIDTWNQFQSVQLAINFIIIFPLFSSLFLSLARSLVIFLKLIVSNILKLSRDWLRYWWLLFVLNKLQLKQ